MLTQKQTASMTWLHQQHHWAGFAGPDFFDPTRAGRQAVIAFLERSCRAMRAAGVRGDWTYSLPFHTAHVCILAAERAALAHPAQAAA